MIRGEIKGKNEKRRKMGKKLHKQSFFFLHQFYATQCRRRLDNKVEVKERKEINAIKIIFKSLDVLICRGRVRD